jgi:hypothetical protein
MEGFTNHLVEITIARLDGHRNSALSAENIVMKNITLKALANSSPGVAWQPWEHGDLSNLFATLTGCETDTQSYSPATLTGLRRIYFNGR